MLRVTALGVVEAWVNGAHAFEDLLTPGWSTYETRLRYTEHDVRALIHTDVHSGVQPDTHPETRPDTHPDTHPEIMIGLSLGSGWYAGRLGWSGARNVYGDTRAVSAELRIEYFDGHQQTVRTDSRWGCTPGSTISADLYDGQTIDARDEETGWKEPGFDAQHWVSAVPVAAPDVEYVLSSTPPILSHEHLEPRPGD